MSGRDLPEAIARHPAIDQWLGFGTDGRVDLRSGKVEIGQGINTAFIQIAADELDIDPARIDLVAGDTRTTPDEGVTAGSRSMQTGGAAVRLAASAARHALLGEAAKLLQARVEDLSVDDGRVCVDGRDSDLSYWTLAEKVDLGQEIARLARPKTPAERNLSGRKLARIDLPAKVLGRPAFVHDLAFEAMLHARVLNPPAPSARLEDLDEAAIRALAGVVAIVRDGSFLAVIADREIDAIRAAEKAGRHCAWSAAKDAPSDPVAAVDGAEAEVETGFEQGDVTACEGRRFSTTVSRPFLSHGSIGPSCAIAVWNDERLTVHCHSQSVFPLRGALAGVFDLDEAHIDVIHVPGAGCYGHNGADDVALDAALCARAVPGRPVRVQWSRADEFARAPLAPAMVTRATAVTGEDGLITAFDVEVRSPPHNRRPGGRDAVNLVAASHLAHPLPVPPPAAGSLASGGSLDRNSVPSYAIANLRSRRRLVRDLPWRTSAMRGLGAFLNVFAIETLIDEIATELGRDPLDYRLAHAADERIRAVLRRAAELGGWPGSPKDGSALGLAYSRYKNAAAYCAVVVRVELDEDIRVTHGWAAVDAGEAVNPDGIANQIEGGLVQAASWTLKEQIGFEGEAVATRDWESYPILTFAEVPETRVEIIDRPELEPLGVGEAAQGPAAAAIANALARAAGARVRALPITRDKLAAALA